MDVNTSQVIHTLAGHVGSVYSGVFSPDGLMILVGNEYNTATLWDVNSGKEIRSLAGHTGNILSVVFSPDGLNLLTGSSDNTAKLMDTNTGEVIYTLAGHSGNIRTVSFSPDGSKVLTCSEDYTAKLWNANSRKEIIQRRYVTPIETEYTIDDPAQWSVLRSTLPDFFCIPENEIPTLWDNFGMNTLILLELPMRQWDKLAFKAVYQEDNLELLLAGSIEYLMEVFNSQIFDDILAQIPNMAYDLAGLRLIPSIHFASEQPVVTEDDIHLIRNFRPESFVNSELANHIFTGLNIGSWGDLALISERYLLEIFGFNYFSFQLIRELWRMKRYAQESVTHISCGFSEECYESFNKMMQSFIVMAAKTPRERTILLGRIGLLEDRIWKLGELGNLLGVTRERIRQIEQKILKPSYIGQLNRFWLAVDEIMRVSNGLCLLRDIAEQITTKLEWKNKPSEKELISALSLYDKVEINNESGWVYYSYHKCFKCDLIVSTIEELFTKEIFERSLADVTEKLLLTCVQKSRCNDNFSSFNISEKFVSFLASKTNGLLVRDGIVKSNRRIQIQAVEKILRDAGRPMHFSEVYNELKDSLTDNNTFTKRNVHLWLSKSENILHWDRGTFVYRKYIIMPSELVADVEFWLIEKLERNVPFVSVAGAYQEFENRCQQFGIISESALYTCLRQSANPRLIYPRYPQIYYTDNYESRIPIVVVLEQFIKDVGREFSYGILQDFAFRYLFLKDFQFNQCMSQISNVVRTSRETCVHAQFLNINTTYLASLKCEIIKMLQNNKHLSIRKIFTAKRITCALIGIENPIMLYSILRLDTQDELDLTKYPKVCLANQESSAKESRSVISEVINYLQHKKAPCSFSDLEDIFIKKQGYSEINIYKIFNTNKIFRFGRGSLVHINALEWTNEKQSQIEDYARDAFKQANQRESYCALISDLLEYYSLPQLANNILWTQTLLGELIMRNGVFRTLGNARNAFVEIPNEKGIESFEDLIYQILKNSHEGASNLYCFQEEMHEAGIIQKKITPSMLGDQRKVCISGQLIMLRDLYDHAQIT